MLRRIMMFSAFAAGLSPVQALAAASAPFEPEASRNTPVSEKPLLLAQTNDLEIYYDERGNRVIRDVVTGEVLAVQPAGTRFDRRSIVRELNRRGYDTNDYRVDERGQVAIQDDEGYDVLREVFPEAPPEPYDPNRDSAALGQPEYPDDPNAGQGQPLDQSTVATIPPQEAKPVEPLKPALKPLLVKGKQDVAALQVLLDRFGASSGVIDGRFGSNLDKALEAYHEITGSDLRSTDVEGIRQALAESGGEAFASYEITPEDAAGPYVASIPEDYSQKATLERMAYTSVTEALAERFHMDENYLKELNPEADFNRPGTLITVVNFGSLVKTPVARIVADKPRKQVRAYDETGRLVAAYPATIGSSDTPSPSGTHAVKVVVVNPNYTYNPKVNFQQGENNKVLTIPPGPNGPVGSIWIGLDKPTYGIHGAPEPTKIGKTASHGCVRLTNFDATELSKIVKPGVPVEFIE